MNKPLPKPSAEALAHAAQLKKIICDEIDAKGPLTLARYMELALYHPQFGYYRNGSQKFGALGDFVTAPEYSPLFAACLARRCVEVMPAGANALFEIGAGSGILAVEIMTALETLNQVPAQYYILELSSELVQRQQQQILSRLPQYYDRFVWLSSWPEEKLNGVVIANELFDAMPVHRFYIDNGYHEYFIAHENGELIWHKDEPCDVALVKQLDDYQIAFANDYDSEVNLLLKPWFRSLANALGQAYLIFIDYGYKREMLYHPERSMGTLMCHLQHHAHDNPLLYPGIQDITTHVDFTLLAEAAIENGFEIEGLQTQAQFLLEQGITDMAGAAEDPALQIAYAEQLKMLLLPNQMGESFKVFEASRS